MKLSWDVNGVKVTTEKLEDGIEVGMERAVEEILDVLERDAKNTIRLNKRVFTTEVINSFGDQTGSANIEDGINSRFINSAKHAGAVEHGVHPSKYTGGGPPISALMPWVIVNLQDWQLDGGDGPSSGGNALKQSIPDEVSQTVDNAVGWANTEYSKYTRLDDPERDAIESTLKSSDLDDLSTEEMYNQIRSWKGDSNPRRGSTKRIVQYASDVKETFGINANPRGIDLYDPEPTYDETKDALKTFNEVSKIFAYNHLDDGDGTFTAHRFPKKDDISLLGKQIWENPLDSEWNLDNNVVNNYSSDRISVDIFDLGMVHEPTVNIEDDLLFTVDHLVTGRNTHEAEVHLRGELDYSYKRNELRFSDENHTYRLADEVLSVDFEAGNFSDMTDEELIVMAGIIRAMESESVKLDTDVARDRMNAWLDEFLSRGLYSQVEGDDITYEQAVGYITS